MNQMFAPMMNGYKRKRETFLLAAAVLIVVRSVVGIFNGY